MASPQSATAHTMPAKLSLPGCALLLLLGLGTGPLMAQAAPPAAQAQAGPPPGSFAARLVEIERNLVESSPRLKRLSPAKRKALIEFVIGNMLFVTAHEFGHGVLAEFELRLPKICPCVPIGQRTIAMIQINAFSPSER
jgi:hypothetical protein